MKDICNIGIFGGGFVGSAVAYGFANSTNHEFDIKVFDIDSNKRTHSLEEMAKVSEFIFLCLPTPCRDDMSIDLSYIEEGLAQLSRIINPFEQTMIIKSTVVPGTCKHLSQKYNIEIVSNPEFLTERRAKMDFMMTSQIIIGCDDRDVAMKVSNLYKKRFISVNQLITNSVTAEFIKYMLNCFFSVKIGFMNEMFQIGQSCGVNWEEATAGLVGDSRVADSHLRVPGHDGKMGFGGRCLPKDLNALVHFAEKIGVDPKIMKATWDKNWEVRGDGSLPRRK